MRAAFKDERLHVAEKDVDAAQKQPEPERESDEENQQRDDLRPVPRDSDSGDGYAKHQKDRVGDQRRIEPAAGVLGHENLLGHGELFEIAGIADQAGDSAHERVGEGIPGQQTGRTGNGC